MADSVLAVVNRGLAKLGEPRLTALGDGSAVAAMVADLLPGLRQDEQDYIIETIPRILECHRK